jgi:hypothetical protein
MEHVPKQPENSIRVILTINQKLPRLDTALLEAIRAQEECFDLKRISRTAYKELFSKKKILIKGQPAKPSSSVAAGTTYVDILGFQPD